MLYQAYQILKIFLCYHIIGNEFCKKHSTTGSTTYQFVQIFRYVTFLMVLHYYVIACNKMFSLMLYGKSTLRCCTLGRNRKNDSQLRKTVLFRTP